MIRRVAWFAFVIALTVGALVLLWQFFSAIVLFSLSLAVAAALRPLIHKLGAGRLSRRTALTVVYLILASFLVIGLLAISQPLARDLQSATNDFLTGYEQAKTIWPVHGSFLQKQLAEQLPPTEDFYNTLTSPEGMAALEGVFGLARGFFSGLGSLAFILILSLYWSADQFRFERLGLSLLPRENHARALAAWRAVETGVGAFFRSEFLQSVVALIVLVLIYGGLGIRYPILLASLVAIARLIPWFGVLLAILPGIVIWMGASPALGFVFVICTLAVLIIVRRAIAPRVFNMPRNNSLPTLLLVIALGEGFGLAGVLLAPILGVALRLLLQELQLTPRGRFSRETVEKSAELVDRISALRRQVQDNLALSAHPLVNRLYLLARNTREFIRGY